MTEKEALKLALEALKYPLNQSHENFNVDMAELLAHRAITAIKEALAEQPAQQDSTCSNALRIQHKAYPRTCKKCGLGPCVELAQQALDKKAENARELGLDYEPVCNKDPQGCWNVRCQLGKKCKNTSAQQEPVATLWQHGRTGRTRITMPGDITDCAADWFKAADLYTSPPAQRKPLTDDEIWREYRFLWPFHPAEERKLASDILMFARAIEAAHGIKENT